MGSIDVSSLLSDRTKQGLVCLETDKRRIVLPPDDARQLGQQLIQAADAATSDEFIFHFAKDYVKCDESGALKLIREFRRYREHPINRIRMKFCSVSGEQMVYAKDLLEVGRRIKWRTANRTVCIATIEEILPGISYLVMTEETKARGEIYIEQIVEIEMTEEEQKHLLT